MAKVKGKEARFYVNHLDVFAHSPEMSFSIEAQTVDSSVYGDDFDQFEVIKYQGSMDFQAFLADDYRGPGDVTDQLSDKFFRSLLIDSSDNVVTSPAVISTIIDPTPAAGDIAYFTQGYGGISMSLPREGLTAVRMNMTETGAISHGKVLGIFETALADGVPANGTQVALGPPSAAPNGYVRAAIHVLTFNITSGTPTVEAKIQSDTTGFPSAVDRLTFDTAFDDKGHEYKELNLSYTTDTHLRYVLTATGGDVTFGGVIVADVV